MDEALKYTYSIVNSPFFPNNSKIIEWRGRVLLYSGDEKLAIKHY